MAYKVVLLSTAEKALGDLPAHVRVRALEALKSIAEYPSPVARIEKLKKPIVGYRRRIGDYRIMIDIDDGIIFVHDIRNRRDAYR